MLRRRKPNPYLRKLAHQIEFHGLRLLLWALARMSWRSIHLLGRTLCLLHSSVLPIRRQMILDNLACALPELDPIERRQIAGRAVYHITLFLAEVAKLEGDGLNQVEAQVRLDPESEAILREVAGQKTRLILATGHFGNWELLGTWMARRLGGMAVVYKPMHNQLVNELLQKMRARWGETLISTRHRSTMAIITALRRGTPVAILADQDARNGGEFIPFFNRPASTAIGMGILAARLKLSIMIVFAIREAPGRFTLVCRPPICADPDANPHSEACRIMRQYHAALEEMIRKYPEQYFWWHNRWKTQPPK